MGRQTKYPEEFQQHAAQLVLDSRRTVSPAIRADRVERDFTAAAPNQPWVADITYLRAWEGVVYSAVVVDAFSRTVVGWGMADPLRTELALDPGPTGGRG